MQSFSSILTRHGFKLWLSNVLGLILSFIVYLISALVLILIGGILFASSNSSALMGILTGMGGEPSEAQILGLFADIGVGLFIFFIFYLAMILMIASFPIGANYGVAIEAVTQNRASIGTYFKCGFKYLGKVIGQMLLIGLAFIPIFIIMFIVFASITTNSIGSGSEDSFVVAFSLIFLLIFMIYMLLFMHAPVILISEKTGVFRSLKLSVRLLMKAFGKVFVTGLLNVLAIVLLYVILFIVVGLSVEGNPNPISLLVIYLVFFPFFTILTILIIVYRYFKHLRPYLFPHHPGGGSANGNGYPSYNPYGQQAQQQPPFTFNPNQMNPHGQQNPYNYPPNNQQQPNPYPPNQYPPQPPYQS
ncbi:hypothetical protein [Thermoflavimicrobium daqui]|uniref:Glycerophosphoryl diester phosphodiesterase membrane domain-containing protein n=1 Tax=Thermoflavimicrobium daqui TaxID=2137476 RepID=A0A364K903_9BACL|nr:hypothetical protein [Thermoflavimicrobium daqui]RAL26775.1 hypothetical protein DL897_01600 [Thermoflavimicrobium daqui]